MVDPPLPKDSPMKRRLVLSAALAAVALVPLAAVALVPLAAVALVPSRPPPAPRTRSRAL